MIFIALDVSFMLMKYCLAIYVEGKPTTPDRVATDSVYNRIKLIAPSKLVDVDAGIKHKSHRKSFSLSRKYIELVFRDLR